MKKIFYPLIASALVTITPFLLTFEKGQDIRRGLVDYGFFIILLVFIFLKDNVQKNRLIALGACFLILLAIAYCDLESILAMKGVLSWWYIFLPILTCSGAVILIGKIKSFSLDQISLISLISLFLHALLLNIYPTQPLFQFPIISSIYGMSSNSPSRDDIKYPHTDSVTITRYHIDTTRSNVVVLVESWGIPMNSTKFNEELAVFNGLLTARGVHFRMYSRTRTAEREDLLDSAWRDSTGKRDSLFMPKRFAKLGYTTSFLFGGDSTIQWRYKYIRNVGFQNVIWTDSATADAVMAVKIDSLLNVTACDSLADSTCKNRQFIAWTTRDTRFPISDDATETERLYYERLFETLRIVADLAKKHPDVRFVVQGDHEPILAPLEFQAKFYRRWVPYVILN